MPTFVCGIISHKNLLHPEEKNKTSTTPQTHRHAEAEHKALDVGIPGALKAEDELSLTY